MIIGPIAVGLILLLLFVTFRSMRLAMLVIFNLPFALIGGVFALYISRTLPFRPRLRGIHRALRGRCS